jgi:hypothetical protein
MAGMIACRCPSESGGCGHIRGEAAEGSYVRLQCRQCRIKFSGRIENGKFICTDIDKVERRMDSRGAPGYVG